MLPLVEPWAECPTCMCETPRRALHVQRNRKPPVGGPYFALLGCERCGLVYVSPRPSADALSRFYVDEERSGWTDRHDEERAEQKLRKKQQLAARMLAPILGTPGRALDIGCGAGDILNVLQDAGWQTSGIEPHTAMRAIAAERHTLLTDIPREPMFDLVALHHVLEHVLSPHELLARARAAAGPAGRLVASVPAFEDAAITGNLTRACGGVHINGFTLPALRNAIAAAGWTVLDPTGVQSLQGRHIVYAAAGGTQVPEAGALALAVDVLRDYGRRLDSAGEFVVV